MIKKTPNVPAVQAVPHTDGWAVKQENSREYVQTFNNKQDCVKFARELAKENQTELFIHGKDGKIQSRDSYGNDPFPPKG